MLRIWTADRWLISVLQLLLYTCNPSYFHPYQPMDHDHTPLHMSGHTSFNRLILNNRTYARCHMLLIHLQMIVMLLMKLLTNNRTLRNLHRLVLNLQIVMAPSMKLWPKMTMNNLPQLYLHLSSHHDEVKSKAVPSARTDVSWQLNPNRWTINLLAFRAPLWWSSSHRKCRDDISSKKGSVYPSYFHPHQPMDHDHTPLHMNGHTSSSPSSTFPWVLVATTNTQTLQLQPSMALYFITFSSLTTLLSSILSDHE